MIFRDDDIFLTESPTQGRQLYDLEKFKRAHELLALKGHKHAIAIIASEIENYPELTEYIKSRKDEFIFGVHGWAHAHYSHWKPEMIEISLLRAKLKIEKTFDVKVDWFFPPWNERSEAIYEACSKIKLKVNDNQMNTTDCLKGEQAEAVCFHYWSDGQYEELKKIILR